MKLKILTSHSVCHLIMKMRHSCFLVVTIVLLIGSTVCNALHCTNPKEIAYTVTVAKSGHGNFTSIQSAIDSIPDNNTRWIRIQISPGTFKEKVTVSLKKPCLFFEGAGRDSTSIEWGDHEVTRTSSTVSFFPENILVKGITFKNTYNLALKPPTPVQWRQAVSARIRGDKSAFYDCAFYGLQDTLWDEKGRHYFNNCYIEGCVDFIFGSGQSIYEKCQIYVNMGKDAIVPGSRGFITAQKKEWPAEPGSLVFKSCLVDGVGKAFLGRAWGPFATVIFANSYMSDVVTPEGWDAWNYKGHESNFTYVESDNTGPGSDPSKREPWVKKLDPPQLKQFLDMSSIDGDGWIEKLPL